ncbi:hypothetical protein QCE73_12445 [Caballeronia sp. LZ029]|uniref:hypothetical protein n=1 Tax=Caballeronia sp. LZ029 TaxID=3038564 RepID=UPI00285E914D|nr:hypothetical protein [Caballeronia sp. LZ029]MDR5743961.1 hypothetical protein [Caballeronia sp. LZ029]
MLILNAIYLRGTRGRKGIVEYMRMTIPELAQRLHVNERDVHAMVEQFTLHFDEYTYVARATPR